MDRIDKRRFDPDEQKRRRGMRGIFSFVIRMVITVALAFALLSTVSYLVIRRFVVVQERPVPNVVGLTPEKALLELTDNKFTMRFDKYEYSRVLEEGRIVSQYPSGGVEAKIGSPVRVVFSKGSPLVNIPDVRGETRVGAGIKLRAADLTVGRVAYKHDSRVKKNAVMAQDPPAGTGAPHGYEVKLLVSLGKAPGEYLMPSLLDYTLPEARDALERLGASVSEVERMDSAQPRNRVMRQSPPAGAILDEERKIILTVSSGVGRVR